MISSFLAFLISTLKEKVKLRLSGQNYLIVGQLFGWILFYIFVLC